MEKSCGNRDGKWYQWWHENRELLGENCAFATKKHLKTHAIMDGHESCRHALLAGKSCYQTRGINFSLFIAILWLVDPGPVVPVVRFGGLKGDWAPSGVCHSFFPPEFIAWRSPDPLPCTLQVRWCQGEAENSVERFAFFLLDRLNKDRNLETLSASLLELFESWKELRRSHTGCIQGCPGGAGIMSQIWLKKWPIFSDHFLWMEIQGEFLKRLFQGCMGQLQGCSLSLLSFLLGGGLNAVYVYLRIVWENSGELVRAFRHLRSRFGAPKACFCWIKTPLHNTAERRIMTWWEGLGRPPMLGLEKYGINRYQQERACELVMLNTD